jgi:hypothetical protein
MLDMGVSFLFSTELGATGAGLAGLAGLKGFGDSSRLFHTMVPSSEGINTFHDTAPIV